jgi:hypothetical protein
MEISTNLDAQGAKIESLNKRGRAKYVNNFLMSRLIEMHKETNGNNIDNYWLKRYSKTYYCSHTLMNIDNKFVTTFCRYKVCLICARIRTAELIESYFDAINELEDKQFVTLTIQNVYNYQLYDTVREMVKSFQKAKDNLRKQKISLKGTRNMEVTYNPESKTYHPHFHCIIENKQNADALVSEWLRIYPDADSRAQDVRPFGTHENDLLEAFKYVNKVISGAKKERVKNNELSYETVRKQGKIYIEALDNINKATSGIGQKGKFRTFQAFGIKKKDREERSEEEKSNKVFGIDFWKYNFDFENRLYDWINEATGETLTNFVPSQKLETLLTENTVNQIK